MKSKGSIVAILIATAVALQAGSAEVCATGTSSFSKSVEASSSTHTNHANAVYNQFVKLTQQPAKLSEAISYLEKNIYAVSPHQATLMVLQLENAQNAALYSWEDQLTKPSIQDNLMKIYRTNDTFTDVIKRTNNNRLSAPLKDARDNGYKLETTEGMFFPIIDYERYKKYRSYVDMDIKNYIDIMAVESAVASSEDAGLMISWKEVAERALSQDKFVKLYPHSNRIEQIKTLYSQYAYITFYGLDNTPLFDYQDNSLDPEAEQAYLAILLANKVEDSGYLKNLQAFLNILEQNKFKLNSTVEQYREKHLPRLEIY